MNPATNAGVTPVAFTVLGTAQPAGSKRAFVNPKTRRVIVTDDAMAGRSLLEGPLTLDVRIVVVRPGGHYGKRGLRPSAPAYPAVRPDVTKLVRAVEDAMTGIVWRDDAQIVDQHAMKIYGEPARVEITVRAKR